MRCIGVVCPNSGNIWEKILQQIPTPFSDLHTVQIFGLKMRIRRVRVSNHLSSEWIIHLDVYRVDFRSESEIRL